MALNLKTRILFVDDEPLILEILQLTMESMKGEWDMRFTDTGEHALELMKTEEFDLVVSDMRMPGISGAQLLNEVMKQHPATLRIILSGYVEREQIMRSMGATHQFLAKPLALQNLQSTLHRLRRLKARLPSDEIRKLLVNRDSLPSIPAVYFRIVEALQAPECPLEKIADIVITDPALTAKLLQLVNSAFFGFAREISDAREAVMLLGLGIIRSLALTMHLFSTFKGHESPHWSVDGVLAHSMRVARFAKRIAEMEGGDEYLGEQAFTAGVLHDVGQLILADNLDQQYLHVVERSHKENRPLIDVEKESLGANHAEVGAFMLDLWGLPPPLVEAVACHHDPALANELIFSPLTAVHAANVIERQSATSNGHVHFDESYLKHLNLSGHEPEWKERLQLDSD